MDSLSPSACAGKYPPTQPSASSVSFTSPDHGDVVKDRSLTALADLREQRSKLEEERVTIRRQYERYLAELKAKDAGIIMRICQLNERIERMIDAPTMERSIANTLGAIGYGIDFKVKRLFRDVLYEKKFMPLSEGEEAIHAAYETVEKFAQLAQRRVVNIAVRALDRFIDFSAKERLEVQQCAFLGKGSAKATPIFAITDTGINRLVFLNRDGKTQNTDQIVQLGDGPLRMDEETVRFLKYMVKEMAIAIDFIEGKR